MPISIQSVASSAGAVINRERGRETLFHAPDDHGHETHDPPCGRGCGYPYPLHGCGHGCARVRVRDCAHAHGDGCAFCRRADGRVHAGAYVRGNGRVCVCGRLPWNSPCFRVCMYFMAMADSLGKPYARPPPPVWKPSWVRRSGCRAWKVRCVPCRAYLP
jgi:hypothetical protein